MHVFLERGVDFGGRDEVGGECVLGRHSSAGYEAWEGCAQRTGRAAEGGEEHGESCGGW